LICWCLEIRCAGHEIIIPARDRLNQWLEEKLSVVQKGDQEKNIEQFLEKELADFPIMSGTSNVAY